MILCIELNTAICYLIGKDVYLYGTQRFILAQHSFTESLAVNRRSYVKHSDFEETFSKSKPQHSNLTHELLLEKVISNSYCINCLK